MRGGSGSDVVSDRGIAVTQKRADKRGERTTMDPPPAQRRIAAQLTGERDLSPRMQQLHRRQAHSVVSRMHRCMFRAHLVCPLSPSPNKNGRRQRFLCGSRTTRRAAMRRWTRQKQGRDQRGRETHGREAQTATRAAALFVARSASVALVCHPLLCVCCVALRATAVRSATHLLTPHPPATPLHSPRNTHLIFSATSALFQPCRR
jgi:hypothetical protein